MKISLCVFATLFLVSSCLNDERKNQRDDTMLPVDTISWSDFVVEETEIFPAQDLVKGKRYIKLDSNEEYLFGGADKMLFREKIYILDRRQKKIVVFNQEGDGVNVLRRVGQGPEEYVQITDFSVDSEGNIVMVDGVSDRLIIYTSRGIFVSSEKLPFDVDVVQCLPNGYLLLGLSTWNMHSETSGKRLLIVDQDLNIKDAFLDFDEYYDDSYWISNYSFVADESSVFYSKPIEDYIYTLSEDGKPKKAYYIDFGPNRIPLAWRKDVESHINEIQGKYQCLKNHTIITDKYIIGTLWDRTETKPFMVNREEHKIYLYGAVAESDMSDICDFRDNSIVSLIYGGKYTDLNKSSLPVDVREYITNDNYVVCVTELL